MSPLGVILFVVGLVAAVMVLNVVTVWVVRSERRRDQQETEQQPDEQERAEPLPDCVACGNSGWRPVERNSAPPVSVRCSCGRVKVR